MRLSTRSAEDPVFFMVVEPLNGKRHVAVTETRTRIDWGPFHAGSAGQQAPTCGENCFGHGQPEHPWHHLNL